MEPKQPPAPCHQRLIEDNGDPSDYYVNIITQIFNRFDRDKDGILSLNEFNDMLIASGEEKTDIHTYGGLLMMFEDVADEKQQHQPGLRRGKRGGKGAARNNNNKSNRPKGVSLKGFIQMSVLSTVQVRMNEWMNEWMRIQTWIFCTSSCSPDNLSTIPSVCASTSSILLTVHLSALCSLLSALCSLSGKSLFPLSLCVLWCVCQFPILCSLWSLQTNVKLITNNRILMENVHSCRSWALICQEKSFLTRQLQTKATQTMNMCQRKRQTTRCSKRSRR